MYDAIWYSLEVQRNHSLLGLPLDSWSTLGAGGWWGEGTKMSPVFIWRKNWNRFSQSSRSLPRQSSLPQGGRSSGCPPRNARRGSYTFRRLLPPLHSTAVHLIRLSLATACPAAVHCWRWHPVWLGESLVKAPGLPGYSASCQLALYPRGYLPRSPPSSWPKDFPWPCGCSSVLSLPSLGPQTLWEHAGISESRP